MTLFRITVATWLGCLAAGLVAPVQADVLVLRNGGRVEGEVLNPDESPRVHFIVKTSAGAQITLDAAQVEQRLHPRPAEQEYEKLAPTYADTAEAQWELATWCAEKGLVAQRKTHLERVIELSPDHQKARAALGYLRDPDTGKWVTRSELQQSRGLVLDPRTHKWMLPQEIELLANKERQEKAEREWIQKLVHWQSELGGNRDAVARDGFHAIKDPAAIRELANLLRSDGHPDNRCLYIDALANIGSPSNKVLAETALNDSVEEVRLSCLDNLKKHKDPDVVSYFVSQLHSKDNRIVNRAAVGLSAMGDRSAIGPLIDALTTMHKFKIVTANPGGPNAMSAGFGKGGGMSGGGMSAGSAPQFFKQEMRNQQVLDALVMLTSVNYGFDKRQWKTWYASQRQRTVIDARRG